MKTCLQTITIELPSSPYIFYGMECMPICPYSFTDEENKEFIALKTKDNSIITWWKNGIVIKVLPDGMTKTWSPKPTLKDIITHSSHPYNKGWYIEFRKDKSVIGKIYNVIHYWSAPISGLPEEGEKLTNYEYDTNEYDEEEIEKKFPQCYNCNEN